MEPIFDAELVLRHQLRAERRAVPGADFLMVRAAADLAERLATVERRFPTAATLFCRTEAAAAALAASGKVETVIRVELDGRLLDNSPGRIAQRGRLPLEPASLDLAVSLLALQDLNDIPGALIQIRRALRPDGLFLAAMAGGETLQELRASLLAAELELTGGASPHIHPMVDVRDAGALLQRAGFALPVSDLETVKVRYQSMFALLGDLRAMGVGNALEGRTRRPATRRLFARAAEIYAERFAEPDGRLPATFAFVWMSGWAPHESQPKPLTPGSAEVSLSKVLGSGRGSS